MRGEFFKVVSATDEAISGTVAQVLEYQSKRDFALVEALLDPAKAMVFNCREIPHSVFESRVASQPSDEMRFRAAFQYGVVSVRNHRQHDGIVWPTWSPVGTGNPPAMTDKECEGFAHLYIGEIGEVIYSNSFLPRWTVLPFPLRSSLHAVLERRAYRSVEPSPSTADSSNAPPSDPTSQSQDTTGSTSG